MFLLQWEFLAPLVVFEQEALIRLLELTPAEWLVLVCWPAEWLVFGPERLRLELARLVGRQSQERPVD